MLFSLFHLSLLKNKIFSDQVNNGFGLYVEIAVVDRQVDLLSAQP